MALSKGNAPKKSLFKERYVEVIEFQIFVLKLVKKSKVENLEPVGKSVGELPVELLDLFLKNIDRNCIHKSPRTSV